MNVRAKFKCTSKAAVPGNGHQITLSAVYDSDPNSENGQFFKWTPSGTIQMGVVSDAAADAFVVDKEFYVDFSPVGEG
jgi:hypothetical protein